MTKIMYILIYIYATCLTGQFGRLTSRRHIDVDLSQRLPAAAEDWQWLPQCSGKPPEPSKTLEYTDR